MGGGTLTSGDDFTRLVRGRPFESRLCRDSLTPFPPESILKVPLPDAPTQPSFVRPHPTTLDSHFSVLPGVSAPDFDWRTGRLK